MNRRCQLVRKKSFLLRHILDQTWTFTSNNNPWQIWLETESFCLSHSGAGQSRGKHRSTQHSRFLFHLSGSVASLFEVVKFVFCVSCAVNALNLFQILHITAIFITVLIWLHIAQFLSHSSVHLWYRIFCMFVTSMKPYLLIEFDY